MNVIKNSFIPVICLCLVTACASNQQTAADVQQNQVEQTPAIDPFTVSILSVENLVLDVPSDDLNKESIKSIQTQLKGLGYAVDAVDGIAGKKTKAVIERFQRDFELIVDGEPSQALNAYLGHLLSTKAEGGVLSQVEEIQQRLINNQLFDGAVDGIPGEKTRQAISSYQAAQGLAVDGQLTQGLLEKLRADSEPASTTPPAQTQKS